MIAPAAARRSATLVSADAAGYSRLMAVDELATIRAITAYREAGERIASEHGGRLVDSPGDNLLFEFADAPEAVTAALRFQASVQEMNAALASHEQMLFRIGIHMGDIVQEGDRIYGSGINIAARLERLARPGGICISGLVRDQLTDAPGLEDVGPQHVKNIPFPVHAFFVDVPGQVRAEPRAHRGTWPALAVMPFDTGGTDPDGDYLADGIAEDLITTLASWRYFPVIARNSSFTYRGRAVDPKTVGRELDAGYLVEGSVRRAGSRVRISAQLLDAESGHHLWADRWNSSLDDVFETQAEIAQAIAVAMRPELLKAESDRAMRQPPADLTAWDYALRGLWHLNRREAGHIEQAIDLLTRAVSLDPRWGFANAHLAHAHYLSLQDAITTDPRETVRILTESAERAVACDPLDANGHLYRALAASVQGRLSDVLVALRRCVELNPSLPAARSLLGQFLGFTGATDEALRQLDRAIQLSPRDPQLWTFHAGRAGVLFLAGRYAEAIESSERAIAVDPEVAPPHGNIAASAGLLGDIPRASAALAELQRRMPNLTFEAVRTYWAAAPPEAFARFLEGLRLAGLDYTVAARKEEPA